MIIGITGGSGSGKSSLLQLIRHRGGLVLDCDAIYHHLLATDASLLSEIAQRFPSTVVQGVLDRKKLGSIVFADPDALMDLNIITHHAVKQAVLTQLATNPPLAAIDAIALFEGGLECLCDVTVAVTAPLEDRVRRLMERDQISEDYARNRIAAQKPDSWFTERCDYTLENNSTRMAFDEQCLAFLDELGIMKEE